MNQPDTHSHPIEPTDEMIRAALEAFLGRPLGNIAEIDSGMRDALSAAFGLLARDYDLRPRQANTANKADPNCVYPDGVCTCGEPEGHTAPLAEPGQCGAEGPDGLRCERDPRHGDEAFVGNHGAYADESGTLVRW